MVHGRYGRGPKRIGVIMSNTKIFDRRLVVAMVVVCLLNVAGHALVLPALPGDLPSHWNAQGMVDATMPKMADLALSLLPAGLLALFVLVPRIDPKGDSYRKFAGFYQGFVVVFTLFMCALSWAGVLTALGILAQGAAMLAFIYLGMGILFTYIGNYLPRVQQNYTMGVKTPWTIDNEEVWQKSQRVGGRVFFAAGVASLVLAAGTFVAPGFVSAAGVWIFLALIVAAGLIPTVYSYFLWKKGQRG